MQKRGREDRPDFKVDALDGVGQGVTLVDGHGVGDAAPESIMTIPEFGRLHRNVDAQKTFADALRASSSRFGSYSAIAQPISTDFY